ncbi:MAG: ABC transporter permease [Oscillospiraceae bacterium]|nr:ABC transporter permease [Oscillospiraceae bacterium]
MKYYIKKIITLIITLFAVSLLAFWAFQVIPGDAATHILGTEATPERLEALREQMGLNRPFLVQYFDWLKDFLFGDMGTSYSYHMSVKEMIGAKLPITGALSLMSFLMIVIVSIPLGMWQGKHAGELPDVAAGVLGQITMSFPPFFLGMIFTLVFGLWLNLFTQGQFISYTENFSGFLGYLFFPALAIALPKIAMATKLLRSSVLVELQQDYVRTARSRGRKFNSVLVKHVLRNALIPVVTFYATTLADIVAGSIIIEQVFSVPGIGRLLLSSIMNRDFPVVQAIVVMMAALVVIVNFITDLLYQFIDPRIKVQ